MRRDHAQPRATRERPQVEDGLQRAAAHRSEHVAVRILDAGQPAGRKVDPVVTLENREPGDEPDPDAPVVGLAYRRVRQRPIGGGRQIGQRLVAAEFL